MKIPQNILQQLVDRVMTERIFQFSYPFLDGSHDRLLIVLNSKVNVSPATLEPIIDLCLSEVPDLSYLLIPSGELKTAIKGGHLFYSAVCQGQNQIYHDGQKPLLFPSREELEAMRTKAEARFQEGRAKAADFKDGMQFYRSKGNLHQAAFMLHQVTELSLRALSMAVFKKDKPTHSLQQHLKTGSRFIPGLATVFPKADAYEYGLLQLLDKAYTTVRYKNNYVIEEEELANLIRKIDPLLDWCKQFFTDCLEASLNAKTIEPVKTDDPAPSVIPPKKEQADTDLPQSVKGKLDAKQQKQLHKALSNIRKDHAVLQFILIGAGSSMHSNNHLFGVGPLSSQSSHYYVLAILPKGQTGRSRTITQSGMKVTLLFEQENVIHYALEKRSRFFIRAISEGVLIYGNDERPIKFNVTSPDWQHSYEAAEKMMVNRMGRLANMFYESAEATSSYVDDAYLSSALLLGQCLEQACIAYIYVHSGYRAEHCHLDFLIDLCRMISPEIPHFFQQKSASEKRYVHALTKCRQCIGTKDEDVLDYDDIQYLLIRTEEIVELAKSHCQTELERLKQLACLETTAE